ncbi:hypothetical protein, partial [Mesorhizobium sp. M7A.F.Ca.MR.362.00.0.0]|uniref:hypothetical protein n=1 Tax=Mesorhizobium sp. M7A.F.Ca.MR.362.00.0.0 TaxID=2496779 RepID=UPI0013E35DB4
VDTFISRESITTQLLKDLKVISNVKQIPDIGFTLPNRSIKTKETLLAKGDVKIGLTLLDWRFAKKDSTVEDIDRYISKVANACNELFSQNN